MELAACIRAWAVVSWSDGLSGGPLCMDRESNSSYNFTRQPLSVVHDLIVASYISWKLTLSSFCQVIAIDYLASR